jgi:pimeloyl-ACP methyl ester carboxylesterase
MHGFNRIGFRALALPLAIAFAFVAGVARAALVETQVEAKGPAGALAGTMLAPQGKLSALVLIIPGSGPTDRDGNSPLGIIAAPYRLLAEGLASSGLATVRIDKRGMFGSAAATPDANAVTIADYVSDVRSWIAALRKLTDVHCVWLLGHSEGGLVALAAAQQSPDLCGLILVATAGRPMGEVLREQLKANPANAALLAQAMPAIDSLEAGLRVDTSRMDPALMPLFAPPVQPFLINAFSYDPAKLVANAHRPVLILQGLRDIQVNEADARRLKAADPEATLTLVPDTNHVLKSVTSDDVPANVATYANSALPIAPGVIEAIVSFVGTHQADNAR